LGRGVVGGYGSIPVGHQPWVSFSLALTNHVGGIASNDRDINGLAALCNLGVGLFLLSSEVWGHCSRARGENQSSGFALNLRDHSNGRNNSIAAVNAVVWVSLTLTQWVPPRGLERLCQKVVSRGGLD